VSDLEKKLLVVLLMNYCMVNLKKNVEAKLGMGRGMGG